MATMSDAQIREQTKAIDALRHRYPEGPPGYGGWLSTLVHNLRNAYLAWPDGKTENRSVQALVEGFLAEIEELKIADIVARNPGINEDEVRHYRATGELPERKA